MRKWFSSLFLAGLIATQATWLYARPRNPYPKTPDQVWQNELDLQDAIDNLIGLSASNANRICIDDPTFCVDVVNNQVLVDSGTISLPGLAFHGSTGTGFRITGSSSSWVASGVDQLIVHPSVGATFAGAGIFGGAGTFGGSGTFAGQILGPNGTALLPTFAWSSEPSSGWYRVSSGRFAFVTAGDLRLDLNSSRVEIANQPLWLGDGSLNAPSLAYSSENGLGFYRSASKTIAIGSNGKSAAQFSDTTDIFYVASTAAFQADSSGITVNAPFTLLVSSTSNQIRLGTTNIVTLSATAPSSSRIYTFLDAGGNANIILSEGTKTINGAITFGNAFLAANGTVSLPGVAIGSTSDGFYKTGTHAIGLALNGTYGYSAADGSHQWALSGTEAMDLDSNGFYPVPDSTSSGTGRLLGRSGFKWREVWAFTGTINTSSSRKKRLIREIMQTGKTSIPASDLGFPADKKLVRYKDGKGKDQERIEQVGPDQPIKVPRGIIFRWKGDEGTPYDQDAISFLGDDLPIEAHAIREDGTRDPDSYYSGAVIGILCSALRDLQARVAVLEKH